jgi:mRNA interferase MazF
MRGDVYRLRADGRARGHEQRGPRFGVVVQATRYLHLSRWLVVPTSAGAQRAIFRPQIELPAGRTLALCDAVSAVDPETRLAEPVSHLTTDEMQRIDRALLGLLDLL